MKNIVLNLSAAPNSLLGGFIILLIFLLVFISVYIARAISLAVSERINRSVSPKNASPSLGGAPKRRYRKKLSPALQSTLKRPTKTIYISEKED